MSANEKSTIGVYFDAKHFIQNKPLPPEVKEEFAAFVAIAFISNGFRIYSYRTAYVDFLRQERNIRILNERHQMIAKGIRNWRSISDMENDEALIASSSIDLAITAMDAEKDLAFLPKHERDLYLSCRLGHLKPDGGMKKKLEKIRLKIKKHLNQTRSSV